jgi:hypothetical protein
MYFLRKTNMKNKKQTVFHAALDVTRGKLLAGFWFRQSREGAAEASPIIILSATGSPLPDPLACSRLIPVETFDSVYRAVQGAPESARAPGGVAFICAVSPVADALRERFILAGAMPEECAA